MNERNECVDAYNDCQSQLSWCDSAVYNYSKACYVKDSIIEKATEVISVCNEDNWQLSNELEKYKRKNRIKNYVLITSFAVIAVLLAVLF